MGTKGRLDILSVLSMSIVILLSAGCVVAEHDAIITIEPNVANCGQLGNTFVVNVMNDVNSSDDIFEVRIYSGTYGIEKFEWHSILREWEKI